MKKNKEPEKNKRLPTPSQEKLITLLTENYRKTGVKRRSLGSILLEAGYSPSTATSPNKILNQPTMKAATDDLLSQLKDKRQLILKHGFSEPKIKKMGTQGSAYVLDVLIKNERLIEGKTTGNIGFEPTDIEKKEIDSIINANKNRK